MKHILFLLSATWLLTGCSDDFFSQTVPIDPPPYEKHLSFHLLATDQDSVVRFSMTRNYGILEDVKNYDDWFVRGASAELYENGQKWLTLGPLSTDSSFELTGVLPHPFKTGSTYEIRASHPDFPSVSAIQIAPSDLNIDSVRIRYDAATGEFGDKLNLLEIFLNDQPGVKNYYEVTLSGKAYRLLYTGNGNIDTVGTFVYPLYVDGYNDPNVVEGFKAGGLISDQFFDGKSYKFQARFYANEYNTIDSTVTVQVRNVTEEYFKWSRSYLQHYNSDENPLIEPISVFNNLENGLGIFTIAREKKYLLKR